MKASPEWESEAVVKRLRETTSRGQPSSVQVFLTDEVSANDLPEKAREIVNEASASLNLPVGAVKIGKGASLGEVLFDFVRRSQRL
jgi:hypothetical protein